MDVSTSRNCQTSAAVRMATLSSRDYASKHQPWILCLCQIAMFATASWCPPSSPPSLFLGILPQPLTPLSAPTFPVAAALHPLVLLRRLTACGPACPSLAAASQHGLDRLSRLHRAGPVNPIHHAGPGHSRLPTLSLCLCHPSQSPPRPLHQSQHPPQLLSLLPLPPLLLLQLLLQLLLRCSPARLTGQEASVSQLNHQLPSRLKSLLQFQLRPPFLSQCQQLLLPRASTQVYQCGPATLVGPTTQDNQVGLGSTRPSCLHTGFHPLLVLWCVKETNILVYSLANCDFIYRPSAGYNNFLTCK